MRIIFEKSGGFMGRTTSLTLNVNELPPDQAETLNHLLDESNFLNLKENLVTRAAPDEFHYSITVVTEKIEHTVHTTDTSAPPSLRALIQDLSMRARTTQNPS